MSNGKVSWNPLGLIGCSVIWGVAFGFVGMIYEQVTQTQIEFPITGIGCVVGFIVTIISLRIKELKKS